MLRQLSVWTVSESKAGIIQIRKSLLWGFPMFETSVTLGWKYSDSVRGVGMLSVIGSVIVIDIVIAIDIFMNYCDCYRSILIQ